MRRIQLVLGILVFLSGCGDSSVFEGLGDDGSPQARKAAAQQALDSADCGKAVDLFKGLQEGNPNSVDHRLDLSAAYLCQAGFSVQGLLNIVTDFASDTSPGRATTKDTLLQKVIAQVSTLIPEEKVWQANVCNSKMLLLQNAENTPWPCVPPQEVVFFQNDLDAGYVLGIVNLADAALAVADALKTIGGIAQCIQSNCTLTRQDIRSIAKSLENAAQSVDAATGKTGELYKTTDNLVKNANQDSDPTLSDSEVLNYLLAQKVISTSTPINASGCQLNAQNQFTCTKI